MQHNPRTVLRQVPNLLLARYFSRFPGFSDFDWSRIKENHMEPVYECWQRLPKAEKDPISTAILQVALLSNPSGTSMLVATARDSGIDIRPQVCTMKNAYERAFWCMLEHPDVFHNGRTLAHIDSMPQKSRQKWTGLPQQPIEVTTDMLAGLEGAIREYYQRLDGRGEACHVEYRRRSNAIDSFFAYPADYVDDVEEFDDDDKLIWKRRRGRFEIAFALNSSAGSLEVSAEGGRQIRSDLCELFLRAVLDRIAAVQPAGTTPYCMDVFKNRQLSFPTDPVDSIFMRVQGLRLRANGSSEGVISVDAGTRSRESAYAVLDAVVDQQRLPLEASTILDATLQAVIQTPRKRPRSITFKVTPSSCTLGDSPEEDKLKRYLKQWRIEDGQCA